MQSMQRARHSRFRFTRGIAVLRGHHVPQKSPQSDANDPQQNSPPNQYRAQRFRLSWRCRLARRRKIRSAVRADFRGSIDFSIAIRADVHKMEKLFGFATFDAELL